MSSSSGNSQSVTRRRRHGRDLPVLRWLQVGTAATGVSVALLAAPGLAAADEGSAASGTDSTTKSAEPHRGTAGTARTRTNAPKTTSSATRGSSKRPNPLGVVQHSADTTETDSKTETPSAATTPAATSAQTPAPGSSTVQTAQSAVTIHLREYPAPVTAPVTVRAIVDDTLSWIGLGDLAPTVPVPDAPVPDLIAAAWVGVRRFHYTFFNSTPTLTAQTYTEDPDTGVITGSVKGYDADGDILKYEVNAQPSHGTVTVTDDGTYTYTPTAAYAHTGGTDTFTLAVNDIAANPWHTNPVSQLVDGLTHVLSQLGLVADPVSTTHTVVTVSVATIKATANDDTFITDPNTPLAITAAQLLSNDSADPKTVSVASISQPGRGSLTDNGDGTYTYTPTTGLTGTDSFTYTITDAGGHTSTPATVTITVAVTTHAAVDSTVTVGGTPAGTALSPDGKTVYVTNQANNTVSAIDTATNKVTNTIAVGNRPFGVAISPDGRTLYVANSADNTVSVINTATATPDVADRSAAAVSTVTVTTIPGFKTPYALAINADGSTLYVTNLGDNSVSVINTATKATTKTITDVKNPAAVAISADSKTLYVTDAKAGTVSVIKTADDARSTITGLNDPSALALSADSTRLYVTNAGSGNVSVINTATNTVIANITGLDSPAGIAVSADKATLYLANSKAGTVSKVAVPATVINSAPTVSVDTTAVDPATGTRLVVAHSSDPDGDPVAVVVVTAPAHGTLTLLSNDEKSALGLALGTAAYRYTPEASFAHTGGVETITFAAQDTSGATTATALTFTVAAINHAPTVTATVGASGADGTRLITVNTTDPDADPVTITNATAAHGTLSALSVDELKTLGLAGLTAGTTVYRYTPDAAFAHTGGTDTLTFTATDTLPTGTTGPAITRTLAVTTAAINHAPTVTATVGASGADGTRLITVNTTDPDADPVTITNATAAHGTLSVLSNAEKAELGLTTTAPVYRYTPDTAFAHTGGTDTLAFTATDTLPTGTTGPAITRTLAVTTAAINHAPTVTASPLGDASGADGSRLITVNTTDPDGDPVTITTTASHGTLTALSADELGTLDVALTAGTTVYRYTPDAAFAHTGGTDTLAFTATDTLPTGTTGPAITTTLAVTTAPINHNPTVSVDIRNINPSTGARIVVFTTSDPDGDPVEFSLTATTLHGALTALSADEKTTLGIDSAAAAYSYTPDAAFLVTGGDVVITFTATDGQGGIAAENSVTTQVVAVPATETVTTGLPSSAFTSYVAPGKVSSSPANESPAKAFDGLASTKYLNFAAAGSGVTIDLGAGNERTVVGLGLTTANDFPERDPNSYELYGSSDGTNFTLISSGALTPPTDRGAAYPDVEFANTTAYRYYRVAFTTLRPSTTPASSVQIAEIRLMGTALHGPVATTNIGSADPDTGTRLIAVSTDDPDNTVTAPTPGHGTLTALTNTEASDLGYASATKVYRYTPDTAFAHIGGTDTFAFTTTDDAGGTTKALVTITTAAINHAPTLTATVGDAEASSGIRVVVITTNDTDSDTVSVTASAPAHGSLAVLSTAQKIALGIDPAAAAYNYTPTVAFAHTGGNDVITFTARDGRGGVTPTSVTITTAAINTAPVAIAQSFSTDQGTQLTFTAAQLLTGSSDADGDTRTIDSVTQPAHGTLSNDGAGTYTYTPTSTFAGTDTFTYTIKDSTGATSAPTAITVSVNAVNAPTTPTVDATIAGFRGATGVAFSANGAFAYVANYNDRTVTVVDNATKKITRNLSVPAGPLAVTFSAANLYVALEDGRMVRVNPNTGTTFGSVGVADAAAIARSSDGTVYAAEGASTLTVITPSGVRTAITGLQNPVAMALSADGATLYVANGVGNTVSVINTATQNIIGTIATPSPYGVAISPDNTTLYVANSGDNTVSVIDTATKATTIITGFDAPFGIAVSPDGTTLYVINSNDTVSVVSTGRRSAAPAVAEKA